MSRFRLLFLLVALVFSVAQTRPVRAIPSTPPQSCFYDDQCPRGFHCCSCQCIIGFCDPAEACPQ
jgi:hypothetical protein